MNNVLNISEFLSSQLSDVEKYADDKLNPIDVDLGKESDHFFQRLNDPRNVKPISSAELIGFFKRLSQNKKLLTNFLNKYNQIVVTDKKTDINIPFMKQADKIIAKTIMRKQDFKTPNPKLKLEKEETVYIEFLNKDKKFQTEKKYFTGKTAYKDAVQWGKENFDKFNYDMIKFENSDMDKYIMKTRYVKLFEDFLREEDPLGGGLDLGLGGGEEKEGEKKEDPIKKIQDEEKEKKKKELEKFKKGIEDKIQEVKDILDKYPDINDSVGEKVIKAIQSKDRTLIHTTKNDLIYLQVDYNKSGQKEKVDQLSRLKNVLDDLDRAFSVDKMM